MPDTTPEPNPLHELLKKLDGLALEGKERALLWAILTVAQGHIQIVDVPETTTYFQDEFATSFSAGPHAGGESTIMLSDKMIIR